MPDKQNILTEDGWELTFRLFHPTENVGYTIFDEESFKFELDVYADPTVKRVWISEGTLQEGTDSTLVYATWSRGYRPGAFNPPVDPTLFQGVAQTTDPEFLDAYEIGMKNVLLDNTLIANQTAFY